MFFGMSYFVGEIDDIQSVTGAGMGNGPEVFAGNLMQAGVAAIAVALLLTAVAAAVCVKVIEKRDYA